MSTNISNHLPLYEILTMLVPGLFIIILFLPIPTNVIGIFLYTVLAYLIGSIYHKILESIRSKDLKLLFYCKTIFTRNYIEAIKKAKTDVCNEPGENVNENNVTLTDYYKAYYNIWDKPCYGNIKQLEMQEAFLRDMTWIVILYCVLIHFVKSSIFQIWADNIASCFGQTSDTFFSGIFPHEHPIPFIIISIVSIILILFGRYRTQMSIYKLVWEGNLFLKKANEQDKSSRGNNRYLQQP